MISCTGLIAHRFVARVAVMISPVETMDFKEQFLKSGFAVVEAVDKKPLVKLREEIFRKCKEIFAHKGDDAEDFFNNFHRLKITGPRLNKLRMEVIDYGTQNIDSGSFIFKAFHNVILELVGPDLLVQKNTNLVIAQPKDPNVSEPHRDAPGNSPYEITCWIPLVDCYDTKALYVLDREETKKCLSNLDENLDDWAGYEARCIAGGKPATVPFGSGLFFWTGLIHGSKVNVEKETRWSLNMRYKNLFSPVGLKDPFEFFKIFQLSPLARLGIEFEKTQRLP